MKVKFNNKIYEKNKPVKDKNGIGLGRLCFDIFKYYLQKNKGKSYEELKNIFNQPNIHKNLSSQNAKRKVIFNQKDFEHWYYNDGIKDGDREKRYFGFGGYSEPIIYNNEKLYFTTQWGNSDGNIDNMIAFARKQDYDIEVIEDIQENVNQNHKLRIIKNIILYGSPGIGKTYNYKNLISMIEKGKNEKEIFDTISKNENILQNDIEIPNQRVKFITFHQSYSYEDFIEGFGPKEDGTIKLEDGIFKIICDEASKNKEQNYYLVIDEINRGNISKIFGELITLIEEDKRDNLEVVLPYSKKSFKIPSNLYIIATMNSTDKSIATVDIALRRRFTFIKMKPNENLVNYLNAKEFMKNINEYIKNSLGEDYLIGHSYFMNIQNEDDLEFVKEYKIKPLLEEYFYAYDKGIDEILEEI